MRPKASRLLTPVLLASLTALALVGVWCVTQVSFAQTRRLPDGSVLSLDAVTYGTQHSFVAGAAWRRLLVSLVPADMQSRLLVHADDLQYRIHMWDPAAPRPFAVLVSAPNDPYYQRRPALVFWISRRDGEGKPWRGSFATPPLTYGPPELLDENGYRIAPSFDTNRGGVSNHSMWWLESFPRRGKVVRLRFYGRDERTLMAEFAAPNPNAGPHPTWVPEPLPITRQSGALAFQLTALTTGLRAPNDTAAAAPGAWCWTRGSFRVYEQGKPTSDWRPMGMDIADATGNFVSPIGRRFQERKGEGQLSVGEALSADESAWKLRVEFARTPHARFAPDEAWTVRGLAVPRWGSVSPCDATAVRQGVKLTLHGIGGLGPISWDGGPRHATLSKPHVWLHVSGWRKGLRITLRAVDDRGRKFAGYDNPLWITEPEHDLTFLLNIPPGAKTLDLTVAVHKSRYVEYLAKPSPAPPAHSVGQADNLPVGSVPGNPRRADRLPR